jgi:iron transport multicopper oxidase
MVIPDSVLINGVGRYEGGPDMPQAVIDVQPRKRYRFRLLNMACKNNFIFSIDNHKLTIIEVDGQYVEPLMVDSIQIHAAQRYSFILETNQPVDSYWLHADPDSGTNSTAVLRYAGSPQVGPKNNTAPSLVALNETNLHPLNPPPLRLLREDGANVKLNMVLAKNGTSSNFLVNGVQYTSPSVPVLLQLLSGAITASDLAPSGSVYTLPRNSVIEISFNPDDAPGGPVSSSYVSSIDFTLKLPQHPFHLHGVRLDMSPSKIP